MAALTTKSKATSRLRAGDVRVMVLLLVSVLVRSSAWRCIMRWTEARGFGRSAVPVLSLGAGWSLVFGTLGIERHGVATVTVEK